MNARSNLAHTSEVVSAGGKLSSYFHPTRFAALEKNGKKIGFIAEIHPRIANKFGIEKRVAVLEISIPDRQEESDPGSEVQIGFS